MVHLRSVTLWLGLIAIAEGLFALGLSALFGADPSLRSLIGDPAALSGALLPAGVLLLGAWAWFTIATASRRAAAEAALRGTAR